MDQLAKTWKRPDEAFKPENTAPPRANKVRARALARARGRDAQTEARQRQVGLRCGDSQAPYNEEPRAQGWQLTRRAYAQAPNVHMLPIVATKGGRGGKGKLLACPIYERMTIDTACHLSAHLHGGERTSGRGSQCRSAYTHRRSCTPLDASVSECLDFDSSHWPLQYT